MAELTFNVVSEVIDEEVLGCGVYEVDEDIWFGVDCNLDTGEVNLFSEDGDQEIVDKYNNKSFKEAFKKAALNELEEIEQRYEQGRDLPEFSFSISI